ncbi:MAG: hypothetical protein RL272_1042 [Candidatus Parcubacteria bacterium]
MHVFFSRSISAAKLVFAVMATAWVAIATAYFLLMETHAFLASFVTYSVISLASEAFFTGITAQIRRRRRREPVDWDLPCKPFLWSIVVYGLSAALSFRLIEVIHPAFFAWPWYLRGVAYMTCIYLWEYFWGWRIEALTGSCPWKYRESPWKIWRYVNPYFFWSWYCFGFVLEFVYFRLIPVLPRIW